MEVHLINHPVINIYKASSKLRPKNAAVGALAARRREKHRNGSVGNAKIMRDADHISA